MLKALYDYARQNDLVLPAGFVQKTVKAYIWLSAKGTFLDVTEGGTFPCPDIGSLANGPDKCNPLAEKRSVIFPDIPTSKSGYFRQLLADGGQLESTLQVCLAALADSETVRTINAALDRMKVKASDRISFCVDGESILNSGAVRSWWSEFRKQFLPSGVQSLCLITGQPTVPPATLPSVNGLRVVGGHSSGDTLICFDKSAFCSYGLKQGANAPVSEEAFAGVKAALDDLLQDAPVLAGMKFVHWYDKPIPQEEDELFSFFGGGPMEEDEADPNEARALADTLVSSLDSGSWAAALPNEYFILLLSGAGGRVMLRHYERGSYQALQKALSAWNEDLKLVNSGGTGGIRPAKFKARLIRLLSRQKNDNKVFQRLDKELSGLTPAIIRAILSNSELPDAVASRALAYIRSGMADTDPDGKGQSIPDGLACQWLKVWLLRRERKKNQKETISMGYNAVHPSPAYHCGALVAVYGAIQSAAMPDVNASIIDRYYDAASQTPALALGQLQRLSNYHLGKIISFSIRERYETMLNQISDSIGDTIPVTLTLEEQAYFALGYRQTCSKIALDIAERKACRKESSSKKEMGGN